MYSYLRPRTYALLLFTLSFGVGACGPKEDSEGDGNNATENNQANASTGANASTANNTSANNTAANNTSANNTSANNTTATTTTELVYPELDDTALVPAQGAPVAISSQNACLTSSDCGSGDFCFSGFCGRECDAGNACEAGTTCSERGRCVLPGPGALLAGLSGVDDEEYMILIDEMNALSQATLSTYTRVSVSDVRPVIAPGQDTFDFTVTFDRNLPAQNLLYRLQRSDSDSLVANEVLTVMPAGKTVTFSIPTGNADPNIQDSGPVNVIVTAATGTYRLTLIPKRPAQAHYKGRAVLSALGADGVPLEFSLHTEPQDAELDGAQRVWIVMPVGAEHLFSPFAPDGVSQQAVKELERDSFTGRWVARFESAYDLSGSSQDVIASVNTTQVLRSMRLELESSGESAISGDIKDYWTGLYESRSSAGNPMLPEVFFEGSIEMVRAGAVTGPAPAEVSGPAAAPMFLPAPPLDACQPAFLASSFTAPGGEVYTCDGIADVAAFAAASEGARASCALAVGETALSGQTTIEALKSFLNGDAQTPNNLSFSDYMRKCAAKEDGLCQPAAEIACGRQLLAHAYRDQAADSSYTEALADAYIDTTREMTLGNQLAAFSNDSAVRLEWLQTSTYPAVVTSEVKDLNSMLLEQWKTEVLDVHMGVLGTQFDMSGLTVLARETSGADAQAARESLLVSVNQSWRGAVDALDLSARRWDTLYQDARDREDASDFVASRLLGLYLSAGILKNLNLSANAGYLSGSLVGGFAALQEKVGRLSLPFSQLIYARDAEVVVSRSLDPTVGNDQLLGELEDQARDSVQSALTRVQMVVDREQAELLNETQLRNRLNNEVSDLRRSLVELCGLPRSCSVGDVDDQECQVRTQLGECGLIYDRSGNLVDTMPGEFGVSEAGQEMLAFLSAGRQVKVARTDLQALVQRLLLQDEEIAAFGQDIESWNEKRQGAYDALAANIAARQGMRSALLQEVEDKYGMIAAERAMALEKTKAAYEDWDKSRQADARRNIGLATAVFILDTTAGVAEVITNTAADYMEAAAEFFPDSLDDPSFTIQGGLSTGAATIRAIGAVGSLALNIEAGALELSNEIKNLNGEVADLKALDDLTYDNMASQALVDSIEDSLLQKQAMTQAEIDALAEIAELLRASMEMELAYERDLALLREKRSDYKQMLTEMSGLVLREGQARQGLVQAMFGYKQVTQRAQLMESKLTGLLIQRSDVNNILGTPVAFFGRSSRLDQAENTMEKARGELFEWLVALEYYAVRPFMDQRLQILLARNPYQLEEIADSLKQIQSKCGGAVNTLTSEFSIRKDGMSVLGDTLDPVTMVTLSAEDRFRNILGSGAVPIDRRVRYATNESIGDLISRNQNVLATTFAVSLDDFANLGQTCNAKVTSIEVQLVGQGLGDARPVVSLLYDGTSYLRSCQPGIDAYVELFGPGATDFGSITYLQAPGRSISPVAGINEFTGNANTSLGGLPLATQYTVLIDTQAGENGKIDWTKLEDIKLELTSSYQDVFPAGQCE